MVRNTVPIVCVCVRVCVSVCVCVYPGIMKGEATHVVVDQAEGKTSVHEGEAPLQGERDRERERERERPV